MGREVLSVPEEKLGEVIRVIRAGLKAATPPVSKDTKENLLCWCEEEENYLKRLES